MFKFYLISFFVFWFIGNWFVFVFPSSSNNIHSMNKIAVNSQFYWEKKKHGFRENTLISFEHYVKKIVYTFVCMVLGFSSLVRLGPIDNVSKSLTSLLICHSISFSLIKIIAYWFMSFLSKFVDWHKSPDRHQFRRFITFATIIIWISVTFLKFYSKIEYLKKMFLLATKIKQRRLTQVIL